MSTQLPARSTLSCSQECTLSLLLLKGGGAALAVTLLQLLCDALLEQEHHRCCVQELARRCKPLPSRHATRC